MAEVSPHLLPFDHLGQIAFTLGLDERLLSFKIGSGGDSNLAYRLRTLFTAESSPNYNISSGTALLSLNHRPWHAPNSDCRDGLDPQQKCRI